MKRNNAEQIGELIRHYLRQESLESPLMNGGLSVRGPKCWGLRLPPTPVNFI